MRKITKYVLHHSVTPKDLEIEKQIQSFNNTHKERLHPKANGYGYHIAYHFVIGGKGEIIKTRPLSEIGYHASNWNVNQESIGICLCGNFDEEKPNDNQIYALRDLLNELDSGLKLGKNSLYFHSDFTNKTCPGKNINKDFIKSLFKDNKEKIPAPWLIYKYTNIEIRGTALWGDLKEKKINN